MTSGHTALLVDFGGVLTSSVTDSFTTFCREVGLAHDLVMAVFLEAYEAGERLDGVIQLLETGRISPDEFADGLARALSERSGVAVPAEGLLRRLFEACALDEVMLAAVARIRGSGIRTALLSNSWGDDGYPRERFPELFDAVVISGEVGLRKPDPAIFELAAARLGLAATACVFVDDLAVNVDAAEAAGMAGVLHRSAAVTLPRLAALLDLDAATLRRLADRR